MLLIMVVMEEEIVAELIIKTINLKDKLPMPLLHKNQMLNGKMFRDFKMLKTLLNKLLSYQLNSLKYLLVVESLGKVSFFMDLLVQEKPSLLKHALLKLKELFFQFHHLI